MARHGDDGQGTFDFGPTLRQLRAEVDAHLQPGMPPMDCRVCTQRVKLYKRKLNSGLAYCLKRLILHDRDHPGKFMDYRNRNARGEARDHTLLRFWGFIEAEPDHGGYWRITAAGKAFVTQPISAPWAIWHFNNRCYGFTVEETTMRRAVADHFDLDELLASLAEPNVGL